MSASTIPTETTGAPTNAPSMTLDVTDTAVTEIKKFMASEEGLPETCRAACSRGSRRLFGFSVQFEY